MEVTSSVMQLITVIIVFLCISSSKAGLVYSIKEELPPNTFVGNIPQDFNLSSRYPADVVNKLTFRFLSNKMEIKVIENSGQLMTAQIIDRDTMCPGKETCMITADILVGPASYIDIIPVEVEVLDINDNTPTFPEDTISIRISELSTPGKAIHTLPSAVDPDSGTFALKGYKLISPEDSDLFALEESRALDGSTELKLMLTQAIDRETIPSHHLKVMAYDGDSPPKTGVLNVNLVVDDENDNPPVFDVPFYEVNVSETLPIGTSLLRVSATDKDDGDNSKIIYSLTPTTLQNFGSIFRIQPNSGEIFSKHKLDFKTTSSYKLVVDASDQGSESQSTQVAVFVNVEDVNEPPEITILTMTASEHLEVMEGIAPYSVIASVSVKDPDSAKNGQVMCSFDNPNFQLEQLASYEKHFKVITTETLDRESIESYDISLTCQDKGIPPLSTTRQVHVIVLDANDHAPVFSSRFYSASIEENNRPHKVIDQVKATDKDIGENARLEYSLSDRNSDILKELFEIEASSGVVRAKGILDHELFSFAILDIVVKDHGNLTLFATAQINVTIKDQNDCKPEFSESTGYTFNILEEELPGIDVGNVSATDADSAPFNIIKYRLEADDLNTLTNFRIDADTGFIKTTTTMDRETDPVYYIRIVAFNPRYDWLSTTSSVTVYLSDINDNGPVVDFPSLSNSTVSVPKNVKLGYVITRVRAHDRDIGVNGQLSFALEDYFISGDEFPFDVDHPTGAITAIMRLTSVETGTQFNLTIVVKDHGRPQFQSVALLTIIIADESPLFDTTNEDNSALIPTDAVNNGGQGNEGDRETTSLHVVIGVACGSTLVIAGLMAAILILSCRSPRRRNQDQGKYNCRVEAQKMLNEKQDRSLDCSSESRSSEEDISPSPLGDDTGQQLSQQPLYSFSKSTNHHPHSQPPQHLHHYAAPASDEELQSILNHDDSDRGVSLMEYDPTHAQKQPWKSSTGQNQQNSDGKLDKPDVVKNSPTKPQLTVCNSCVVTEDKNQFATRLVPLTDKEIEIHKILRFLHSQQDDVTDRCSDSMSTSDSGKGASVSEDCEAPGSNNPKPIKQVHFVDQQKPHHQMSPDGSVTAPGNSQYQYPHRQASRNSPTPLTTFSNTPGTVGNHMKQDGCDSSMAQQRTLPHNKPAVSPSYGNCQPAPVGQHLKDYTYPPGRVRGTASLPHQRRGSKDQHRRYAERGNTLDHPRYREEDNANGIIGNLSDDSDGNSTMSGSYVLVQDDMPSNVHHLSRLKDSIV